MRGLVTRKLLFLLEATFLDSSLSLKPCVVTFTLQVVVTCSVFTDLLASALMGIPSPLRSCPWTHLLHAPHLLFRRILKIFCPAMGVGAGQPLVCLLGAKLPVHVCTLSQAHRLSQAGPVPTSPLHRSLSPRSGVHMRSPPQGRSVGEAHRARGALGPVEGMHR